MVNKLMFGLIFGILLIGMVSATITVTLNSPADGSIQFNNLVNLNATLNVTGTDILVNASLYDNSSGTFAIRNTTQLGSQKLLNGGSGSAATTTTGRPGIKIRTNISTMINNFTTQAGVGATVAYIQDASHGTLATASIVGNTAIFNYILLANNDYFLVVDKEGASFAEIYKDSVSYPYVGTSLNITKGWDGSSEVTGTMSCVDKVGYTNNVLPNTNFTTNFINNYSISSTLWNIKTCDNTGNCVFDTSNRTFVIPIAINSFIYNATSYETAYETYAINLTANSSLTDVYLNLNGTIYPTTYSGGLWTYSKYITSSNIGNNTINFTYTYQGVNLTSSNVYQNVSSANISACNGVYTTKYINFSFIDEATGLPVNAQITSLILNYKLSSASTVFKTLTYSNTTEAPNYYFCAIPSDKTYYLNYTIAYKNGSSSSSPFYPQRVSEISTTAFTNVTTNTTLYLLNDGTGIYVTFQVTNQADQLLSGVSVNATRIVGSSNVTVAAGTTSAAGTVTFWLNPDALHTFTFAKAGYTTYVYSDYPTQASYTVSLSGGGDSTLPISYSKGMNYNIFPTNSSLTNDTTYTFGFKLTSSYWTLQEYGFVLRFDNGTSITSSTSSISGTLLSMSYNTGNTSDKVFLDYYWKVNNTYTNGTIDWRIYSTDNTRWSIRTFFDDFNAYFDSGLFGLDNFGRYLIVFLILFLSVGIMAYKYGFTDPLFLTGLLFFVVMFLDVGIGIIPDITIMNGNAVPHLLTFITGLIFVVSIISEVSKR